MLIPFVTLVSKYGLNIKGILHVGAHECEEIHAYETVVPREKILWVEAMPEKVEYCKNAFTGIYIANAVISDKVETVQFNIANNGQSSSILELGLHLQHHPQVSYVSSFEVETQMLKDILPRYNIECNFLNFDIQGHELSALKGMEDYLKQVDYIYTEVNSNEVYKKCAIVGDIDEYLKPLGFNRVETVWTSYEWGDAFYIKTDLM